ncbi:Nif3-like dinuclear metal center hexameric protein [Tomitella cavernea]|uniref:GTP cyclohydrolase 1 type 2 homolog n=1 Tax=Tomitella cavernea TaxID=1387982 RepID=A0ABP9CSW7_9ACTN|nr:Nif3-like dinuclear metal center hexameric protein [Tomitella cavernea]
MIGAADGEPATEDGGAVPLGEIIAALDEAYPPSLAQSWDSVGLVCGDPAEPVASVLLCVDATSAVVDQAVDSGAQLIVAHHPLLLRGVDTVGAHTPKGTLVHRLIRSGCALFTAHTNADSADPGVSDALAAALGLTDTVPLDPLPGPTLDKWAVMVPGAETHRVRAAMFDAGAGRVGDYDSCSWSVEGDGQFRPLAGAEPAIGSVGALEHVREHRVEMVAARALRERVRAAVHASHPYEEPAYDLIELASEPSARGLGRIGELPRETTLAQFVDRVAQSLPATAWGVRAAGDPDRPVRRVAVCGGSGDSMLGAATAAGVDAYVTADLRHHPADEHLRAGGPALVDVAHWASEFPWCAQAASMLRAAFGDRLAVTVSGVRTDPWTMGASATE